MNPEQRDRFDALVQDAVEALPPHLAALLEEMPLVVLDEPTDEMLRGMGIDPAEPDVREDLCGLHTGVALTERGIDRTGELPTVIHLFRRGILAVAGGWRRPGAEEEVYEQIRITLLHEIGHHFGLEEDDLDQLGYA